MVIMKRKLNSGKSNFIIQWLFESKYIELTSNEFNRTFRAADLLLAGAVMNQEFQAHEAHVPFNLQVEFDLCFFGIILIIYVVFYWL